MHTKHKIINITRSFQDYPDDISYCFNIFFAGCDHDCPGCQNKELQNKEYIDYTTEYMTPYDLISHIKRNGYVFPPAVAFMGGDPLHEYNISFVNKFLSTLSEIPTIIYTGYEVEEAKKRIKSNNFNYLKCGKFDKAKYQEPKKTKDGVWFASTNQKLYNRSYTQVSNNGFFSFR